jgi:hypothetical protein
MYPQEAAYSPMQAFPFTISKIWSQRFLFGMPVRQMQPKMGDRRRFCQAVWHSSLHQHYIYIN